MLVKTSVLEAVQHFPDNFSIDELIEKLLILEKIEKGNNQSVENKIVTEEKLNEEIEKWFK